MNPIVQRRSNLEIPQTPNQMATMSFPVTLPNQNFALISYVGPQSSPICGKSAFRIYGTFATQGDAEATAQLAQEQGFQLFDLDIVDLRQGFFPLPPPSDNEIENVNYIDPIIHKIMSGHKQNLLSTSFDVHRRADGNSSTTNSTTNVTSGDVERMAMEDPNGILMPTMRMVRSTTTP